MVEVISDLDVSGSDKGLRLERPGLRKIRERFGSFDVVIFAKLDRMARNVVDFMAFAKEAEDHGATFVSVSESLDLTSASGRFIATILTAFAEMEAAMIATRVTESIDSLRNSGRYSGGNLPFGYRSVPNPSGNGRVLEIDPVEAAEVRNIAQNILAGRSLYSVMLDLNERHVPTRRGKNWSIQALRQMLTSDAIQGRVTHRGNVIRDDETGLPLQLWPAVLESEVVSRLRSIVLSDRLPGTTNRRKSDARLLSGLARCAECHGTLYPKSSTRPGKEPYASYDCSSRSGGRQCDGCSVSAVRLEDYVTAAFLKRYSGLEVTELRTTGKDEADAAEVERAIVQTAHEMTLDGADVANLADRLMLLKSQRSRDVPLSDTLVVGTGRSYGDTWLEQPDRRSRLLAANIESLLISKGVRGRTGLDPTRIQLVWKKILLREARTDIDMNRASVSLDEVEMAKAIKVRFDSRMEQIEAKRRSSAKLS